MADKIFEVRGSSLVGLLNPGDTFKLDKTKEIKPNDLVVFADGNDLSVKLCLGVGGSKIRIDKIHECLEITPLNSDTTFRIAFRNDSEAFCWNDWIRFSDSIPEGFIYLTGTHNDSIDSRSRGYYRLEQVVGIVKK